MGLNKETGGKLWSDCFKQCVSVWGLYKRVYHHLGRPDFTLSFTFLVLIIEHGRRCGQFQIV